jgi:hypothetical protein
MVRYIYQDQKRDLYNKSLQLTPWRLVRTAHAVLISWQCLPDAAGQLNSMLGRLRNSMLHVTVFGHQCVSRSDIPAVA